MVLLLSKKRSQAARLGSADSNAYGEYASPAFGFRGRIGKGKRPGRVASPSCYREEERAPLFLRQQGFQEPLPDQIGQGDMV